MPFGGQLNLTDTWGLLLGPLEISRPDGTFSGDGIIRSDFEGNRLEPIRLAEPALALGFGSDGNYFVGSLGLSQYSDTGGYAVRIANEIGGILSPIARVQIVRGRILNPRFAAGEFGFVFSADRPSRHSIETSTNLVNWAPVLNLTNQPGLNPVAVPLSSGSSRQFFRLVELAP